MFEHLKSASSKLFSKPSKTPTLTEEEPLPSDLPEPFDLDTIPLSEGSPRKKTDLSHKEIEKTKKEGVYYGISK